MRFNVLTCVLLIGAFPFVASPKELSLVRLDGTRISAGQIDSAVTGAMKTDRIPGVGIAIFDRGTIAYQKTFGERNQASHKPLTPHSVMTAASLTKAVFAVLVLQLVEKSVLDLDQPVVQYLPKPLPEYRAYRDLASDACFAQITLRMLLDHSSGFPNWRWMTDDHTLRIYFDPGSRFAYSGEGIALAQLVVESVTGKSITDLMRQHIFRPLKMTRTSMVWEPAFESDYANAYDEGGTPLGPQRRRNGDAAGSMQTTLHDYALFVQAVLTGKLLDPKSTATMFAEQIRIKSLHEFPTLSLDTTAANDSIHLSYDLGWGLYWTPIGEAFFKEGHDDGLRHYVVCFVKPKSGILIMTNSANGEDAYATLLTSLIHDTYTPYEWEGFKAPQAIAK